MNLTPQQEHYTWIQNIIDSCLHDFHFSCIDKLIELFAQQHKDEHQLHLMLQQQRAAKWNHVHHILT